MALRLFLILRFSKDSDMIDDDLTSLSCHDVFARLVYLTQGYLNVDAFCLKFCRYFSHF